MAVNVISPGLSTTVQDLGRPGYYHLGIPISGGMDRFALRAANMLVGNDEGAAVLEAVFLGPELEFTGAATVAVTGGDLPPKLNGDDARHMGSLSGEGGRPSVLRLSEDPGRGPISRCRAALMCRSMLGSRSTYTLGALGGHEGRALKAGDKLPVGKGRAPRRAARFRRTCAGCPGNPAELRMLPGLYWHRITAGRRQAVLCRHLEGRARGRPHRLPLQGRQGAGLCAARASPLAQGRTRRTSSMPAIPMARFRCRAAPNRSCCTAMRCRAAAT